jgi:outer membrane protein assembly factor BamE
MLEPVMPKSISLTLAAVLLLAATAGCIGPYRVDVQQGNALPTEAVQKLQAGMGKKQVRYLLGTPLVTDPFHADRWDYVYLLKKGNGDTVRQTLSLHFHDGALASAEGDLAPEALRLAAPPN